jgi:hypothetical protein
VSGQLYAPTALPPEKQPMVPVVPQSRSGSYTENKISCPCRKSSPDSSVVQPGLSRLCRRYTVKTGEAVTLETSFREGFASNLGRDTGYCKLGFSWLSSISPAKCRGNIVIKPRPLPSKSFPIRYSLTILPFGAI